MAGHSLRTIAEHLAGELRGDPEAVIERVRSLEQAGDREIAVLLDRRRHASSLATLHAQALIVPAALASELPHIPNLIAVERPRQALIALLNLFHPQHGRPAGVEPGALVSPEARLGPDVFVASGARIERGTVVGARSQIHAHVDIGENVTLGSDVVLHPHVVLYAGTRLGDRVRINAGTVIGSDGFGYPREEDGTLKRVPQIGIVEIEDDVEIGANCTIDRATLEKTLIRRGTKIDNLVQIGHNSDIGEHCCIMGQVGISGSVKVGNFNTLCGQVGLADHVTLADQVVVGAQSGVPHDLTPGVWLGTPALLATQMRRVFPALSRLPQSQKDLRALQERLTKLEGEIDRLLRGEEIRCGNDEK